MKLNGARIVAQSLVEEGVKVIFGMPGGAITPFYDVLPEFPIHHVLVRHEQGAAHMADGYGRASRDVGVCCATSGPGAINLVPGIAAAYLDSSPMVAITANVPSPMIGTDAFQECDITGITLPVTKHYYLVERVKDLPRVMKEAFFLARTGRPGPGAGGRAQGRAAGGDQLHLSQEGGSARLQPHHPGQHGPDQEGRGPDQGGQAAR